MKKTFLVCTGLVLMLLLSACTGAAAPADTVTPPQKAVETSRPEKNLMEEFNKLKEKNSSPAELLSFIKPEVGNLEKEDADTVVKTLLERQQLLLENYEEKLMSEDFNVRINRIKYEDLVALRDIKDQDIRELLQNAYNDGFKLSTSEGMVYLELDYTALKDLFSQFASDEMAAYLDIKAEESKKHFAEDAAIAVSLDDLAARVVKAENFLMDHKDSSFYSDVKALHSNYLTAYLIGLNNTPAFSYEDNFIKPEFMESFKGSEEKYPDSALAKLLKEYVDVIEKNKSIKTKEVLDFANKAAGGM